MLEWNASCSDIGVRHRKSSTTFNSRLGRIAEPALGTRFRFLAGDEADLTLMFHAIYAALRVLVF